LTPQERKRGERLGALLRAARGDRSMVEIAAAATMTVRVAMLALFQRGRPACGDRGKSASIRG
jgi:hypothetical protein